MRPRSRLSLRRALRALRAGAAARRGAAVAALLGAALPASAGDADARFDWCAAVATRPLERFRDAARCTPWWSPAELAGAEVVMLSASELAPAGEPGVRPDACYGELSLERHARWIGEVREAARAVGGRPPLFVAFVRFDLVGPRQARLPGFDASFLVRTERPWAEVEAFFSADRSPDCAAGCRILPPGSEPGVFPVERRPDAEVVYYLERSSPGQTTFRPGWALGDLRSPAYRAWRVAEMRQMLALGGYDAVDLNHKHHQFRPRRQGAPQHWIGGREAPDVSALNASGDTLWTAPPRGYGYAEYVAGWAALAADLRAARVPYTVLLNAAPWVGSLDDPASVADEAESIRQVARGARAVLLDGGPGPLGGAGFEAAARDLRSHGVQIVRIDTRCGRPGARFGAAPLAPARGRAVSAATSPRGAGTATP